MNRALEEIFPDRPICVNERKNRHEYAIAEWRRAFRHYLDAIWSQPDIIAKGIIAIGTNVIVLEQGMYAIYFGITTEEKHRPEFHRTCIHAVTSERKDLELGLAKFLRNDGIKMLVIEWPEVRFILWKGEKRTELDWTVVTRTF